MPTELSFTSLHLVGIDELKKRTGWVLALGILLLVVGIIALAAATLTTLATVLFLGVLMIAVGLLESFLAFAFRRWGGFFLSLLTGILSVVVGAVMVVNPEASALALTLLIVMFLIFSGLSRMVLGMIVPFQNRTWLILHGLLNLLLGLLIWQQWPVSGLWVIGLFIGIDMIFNGWSLLMLGLALRQWQSRFEGN